MYNKRILRAVIISIAVQVFVCFVHAHADDSSATNAERFRQAVSVATDSIVLRSNIPNGSTISIAVVASEESRLIEQAMSSALKQYNVVLYADTVSSVQYLLVVTGAEFAVTYDETHHESFLGEGKTKRTVSAVVPYTVTERTYGQIISSETIRTVFSDTVATAMIPRLEQKQFPETIAPLPERGFFDKLVEPLIIIGATGVAVFLFFHVRS